jgi:hypothetical protein
MLLALAVPNKLLIYKANATEESKFKSDAITIS